MATQSVQQPGQHQFCYESNVIGVPKVLLFKRNLNFFYPLDVYFNKLAIDPVIGDFSVLKYVCVA